MTLLDRGWYCKLDLIDFIDLIDVDPVSIGDAYDYNVLTTKDYRRRGPFDVVAQTRDTLAGRPVFIAIDLRCLGPTMLRGMYRMLAIV